METQENQPSSEGASKRLFSPDLHQSGLCSEAQADGVPCQELGRECHVCERAQLEGEPQAW